MAPETDNDFQRLVIIGLGYVGLPTAAVFADRGFDVVGVDTNARVVERINAGGIHIVEPDLERIVTDVVAKGRLKAAAAPTAADAFILAVPTPLKDGHEPDLDHLWAAADSLASVLEAGDLIVVESTVPVGTTEALSARLADLCPGLRFPHEHGENADVQIAHSPERVLPGQVVKELVGNDRVIGGVSPRCGARAAALYGRAIEGECLVTTAPTAELVKLMENAYRDVNIAFANEISLLCDRLGIDPWEAVALANHHPRVNVLQPGPGVGGHCIAVDPWFIVESAPDATPLIQAARAVNDQKPLVIADKVIEAAAARSSPVIACLGLAYKADIDDLRESPAVTIALKLADAEAGELLVVEPHIEALPGPLADREAVSLTDLDDALTRADIVVLLTDHAEFKAVDRAKLAGKTVFDTRGAWR